MTGTRKYVVHLMVTLGALFLFVASPAHAVTFHFSFTSGGMSVAGNIYGLSDNGFASATNIEVTSNTDGFGIGNYLGTSALINGFTTSGGVITSIAWEYYGGPDGIPACCSLVMYGDPSSASFIAGLSNSTLSANESSATDFTFQRVSEVPLPGALPLFATGLGALGLLGWCRKRKQAAE